MPRMFRVLGFFCLIIGLLSLAYGMVEMSLLFFFQTAVFVLLGYMNLSEKAYILTFWDVFVLLGYMNLSEKAYILTFWAYLVVSTVGLTYGAFF